MTIHMLVEGPSERAFLERWAPRVMPGATIRVHPHQGKGSLPSNPDAAPDPRRRGLLDQLPAKLRAFARTLNQHEDGVLILVDADNDDPTTLLTDIRAITSVHNNLRSVVTLAVEEMEAFYLGDLAALKRAFPDADLEKARAYKPDSICGTWECFGEIVHDGGGNKVAWAEAMGPRVTTQADKSRSPSFKELLAGMRQLSPQPAPAAKKRQYRHPTRVRTEPGRRRR